MTLNQQLTPAERRIVHTLLNLDMDSLKLLKKEGFVCNFSYSKGENTLKRNRMNQRDLFVNARKEKPAIFTSTVTHDFKLMFKINHKDGKVKNKFEFNMERNTNPFKVWHNRVNFIITDDKGKSSYISLGGNEFKKIESYLTFLNDLEIIDFSTFGKIFKAFLFALPSMNQLKNFFTVIGPLMPIIEEKIITKKLAQTSSTLFID